MPSAHGRAAREAPWKAFAAARFVLTGNFPLSDFTRVALSVAGGASVTLIASVNGVVIVSGTDSSAARLQAGAVGLYSGTSARTQYDDFSATSQ